jgi:hypothetical protein
MGNICSWCIKDQVESQSNGNHSQITNSQHSLFPSEINDRTPYVIID